MVLENVLLYGSKKCLHSWTQWCALKVYGVEHSWCDVDKQLHNDWLNGILDRKNVSEGDVHLPVVTRKSDDKLWMDLNGIGKQVNLAKELSTSDKEMNRSSFDSQIRSANSKYVNWTDVANKKRDRYPYGIRKSDLRKLPGTGEWGGRRRLRTQTGATNRKVFVADASNVDMNAVERHQSATADTVSYYKRTAKLREKGLKTNSLVPTSPDLIKQPKSIFEDILEKNLSAILNRSFTASDTTKETSRELPLIRTLDIPNPMVSSIANIESSIRQGMVFRSKKPERAMTSSAAVRVAADEAISGPVFPDALVGKTRLGATRFSVTRQMTEMDPSSSGFASSDIRYESRSRGLDLTWQKEHRILSQAACITKLRKRAAHEHRISELCAQNDVLIGIKEERRAAARSVQQLNYLSQVEQLERHRSNAR